MFVLSVGPSIGCWSKGSSTTPPRSSSRPTTQIPASLEAAWLMTSKELLTAIASERGASFHRETGGVLQVDAPQFRAHPERH
jgi:hypothetical protein